MVINCAAHKHRRDKQWNDKLLMVYGIYNSVPINSKAFDSSRINSETINNNVINAQR